MDRMRRHGDNGNNGKYLRSASRIMNGAREENPSLAIKNKTFSVICDGGFDRTNFPRGNKQQQQCEHLGCCWAQHFPVHVINPIMIFSEDKI